MPKKKEALQQMPSPKISPKMSPKPSPKRKAELEKEQEQEVCILKCAPEPATRLQKIWVAFLILASVVLLLYMLVCVCVHH
jgi:hypothetical protein